MLCLTVKYLPFFIVKKLRVTEESSSVVHARLDELKGSAAKPSRFSLPLTRPHSLLATRPPFFGALVVVVVYLLYNLF